MVAYHAAWFATDAGLLDVPIRVHPGWVAFQKGIAGTFFALVGVSLQLAGPLRWRPFARRLGLLLGGAAIVTVTSLFLDPSRVVSFGILHAIAVCSVVAVGLKRLPAPLLVLLSIACGVAGVLFRHPFFDHPGLHWTGLSPTTPRTFDHQPLLPWLGVAVAGLWIGRLLPHTRIPQWKAGGPLARLLCLLGRHSLFLYMAHVPILVGVIALFLWLT